MKNLKYYAGFFDADGSFDLDPTLRENGEYYINIRATIYQKDITPLKDFAKHYGVDIKPSKGCSMVALRGSKAEMFMKEVKKHLVIKGPVVEFLLPLKGITVTKEELRQLRKMLKTVRTTSGVEKNYPSRKWMAGYVDGDGCLLSSFRKKDGVLEFKLTVTSHHTQNAGLLLMSKIFGGYITAAGDVRQWHKTLSVSSGKVVLEYFGKHLVHKKEQSDLILNCLRSRRHLRREGATYEDNLVIHKRLQDLKKEIEVLKSPATTKCFDPEKGCDSLTS